MVDRLADRIGVAHLRSTQVNPDGSFFEAGHLEGRVPMAEVVEKLLKIQDKRLANGGERIIFRPDHGRDIWGEHGRPGSARRKNRGKKRKRKLRGTTPRSFVIFGIAAI